MDNGVYTDRPLRVLCRGRDANLTSELASYRQQIATVLTASGRIAAATYRITLVHAGYSLHFTSG